MTRPLSNDLRERVVAALAGGASCRAVAARFGVAVSSVVKWSQRYRATGSVRPRQDGRASQAGAIVIMDNLGSHKSAALRRVIKAASARLWYLPPYSPDLNPIEQTFAKIKHWLRLAQKRSIDDTWRYVGDLVKTIQPDECINYFANAGYASVNP